MKLIYKGKFDGDLEKLTFDNHQPGAVSYKEFDDMKTMGLVLNIVALIMLIPLYGLLFWRGGFRSVLNLGSVLALLALFPHEILHACCFKGEVYFYTNWSQGMLFVTGPETMSPGRFIFMSMLPNLVFGFLPMILFLIWPKLGWLGTMGALSIAMGAGDYYNVWNTLRQVPKGARVYLNGIHSYWYIP